MHALLLKLSSLTSHINTDTAELLRLLGEIDDEKLYLEEACPSLYAYLTERLHYDEGAAYKRIRAARVAQRFPVVLEMVARGELHLAGICLLAPVLSQSNHADVLERARHRSKRQIEKLIAELQPEGAERTYHLSITLTEATHAQLEKLKSLLAHQIPSRDPAHIVARAIDGLLHHTLAKKAALVDRPRPQKSTQNRASRAIPAAIRRQVWLRDQGQCTFFDRSGRRCSAVALIEFHHRKPWAMGGEHSVQNVTLRCAAHNRQQAVLDYGAELIGPFR